jgi:hypothetical protein
MVVQVVRVTMEAAVQPVYPELVVVVLAQVVRAALRLQLAGFPAQQA